MSIGTNIQYYRKKAELTQKELSEHLGIAITTVMKWEQNQREPKSDTLIRIAEFLGISVQDLFNELPLTLGELIAKARKEKGLTQQQLADRIGKTESSIRKYENGSCEPPLGVIMNICGVLEVDVRSIVGGGGLTNNRSLIDYKTLTVEELKDLIINATTELASRGRS